MAAEVRGEARGEDDQLGDVGELLEFLNFADTGPTRLIEAISLIRAIRPKLEKALAYGEFENRIFKPANSEEFYNTCVLYFQPGGPVEFEYGRDMWSLHAINDELDAWLDTLPKRSVPPVHSGFVDTSFHGDICQGDSCQGDSCLV